MGKRIDMTGHRFGRWLVVSYAGDGIWNCRCDCGNEAPVIGANLRNGRSQSCGCLGREKLKEQRPATLIDETGNRYDRLLVLRRADRDPSEGVYWECQCDCGNLTEVRGKLLRSGHTTSCGCKRKETSAKTLSAVASAQTGENHPRWKGDDLSYTYAHVWVARHKEKTGVCEICGERRYTEWANRHPDRRHSRNLDDYIEVCKPHHMLLDGHPWVKRK